MHNHFSSLKMAGYFPDTLHTWILHNHVIQLLSEIHKINKDCYKSYFKWFKIENGLDEIENIKGNQKFA